MKKYVLPKSWTWRIGVFLIACGLTSFVDNLYSLGFVGDVLRGAFGTVTPFSLVLTGAGTITMRGALPDVRGM